MFLIYHATQGLLGYVLFYNEQARSFLCNLDATKTI